MGLYQDFLTQTTRDQIVGKTRAVTGLNAFNFILQSALFILSTLAACRTNNCCEKKTNLKIYVGNNQLREFTQPDFYLSVSEPEHLSLSNIIDMSTSEYKRIQKDKILKRKEKSGGEAESDEKE